MPEFLVILNKFRKSNKTYLLQLLIISYLATVTKNSNYKQTLQTNSI